MVQESKESYSKLFKHLILSEKKLKAIEVTLH